MAVRKIMAARKVMAVRKVKVLKRVGGSAESEDSNLEQSSADY